MERRRYADLGRKNGVLGICKAFLFYLLLFVYSVQQKKSRKTEAEITRRCAEKCAWSVERWLPLARSPSAGQGTDHDHGYPQMSL